MTEVRLTPAPRGGLKRWMWQLIPSWSGLMLATFGFVLLAVGFFLGGSLFLLVTDNRGVHDGVSAHMFWAVIVAPAVALCIGLGGLLPGRSLGRGLLLLATAGVILTGGVSCAEVLMISKAQPLSAWLFAGATYGSVAAVFGVAAVGMVGFTPFWLREELEAARSAWIESVLVHRGAYPISHLSLRMGVTADVVRQVAMSLVADRRVSLRWEGEHDWMFSAQGVSVRMEALVAEIRHAGRIQIEALALSEELSAPLVALWVDELIANEALKASHDRAAGEVLYAASEGESKQVWCVACGGPVRALGGGLGRCGGCDRETDL